MRSANIFAVWSLGVMLPLAPIPSNAQSYTISTFAGGGQSQQTGVPATSFFLTGPTGLAVDASGNVYIVDQGTNRVFKVTESGILNGFAGQLAAGYAGDGGPAVNAELDEPHAVAVDSSGNAYIADYENWVVRKVASNGTISTFAGNGQVESTPVGTGDGGSATSAELSGPTGVAVDSSENVYIADNYVGRVRKVSGGIISTVVGTGIGCCTGAGGPALNATISPPEQIAFDNLGNLLIAESNAVVQKLTPGGILLNEAGDQTYGYLGDGGPAISAELSNPIGVAADSSGNVYVADTYNNVVRMVTPGGIISTIAGNGTCGFSGDGGPAISAELCQPMGLAVSGNTLYIADYQNARVRMITLPSSSSGPTPSINQGGVLNAASYAVSNGAGAPVAPGSLVAIFTSTLATTAANFSGTSLAPSLSGVTVTFNGIMAPIAAVDPSGAYPYVSVQVPFEVSPGTASVVLTVNETPSAPVETTIVASAPGVFTIPATGQGNAILVFVNPATNQPAIAAPTGRIHRLCRSAHPARNQRIFLCHRSRRNDAVRV
jgi:hypothetical protein